jgi:dTDP-4-amino-4,6-dideoxygalactose transaminase
MILTDDEAHIRRARYLSMQAQRSRAALPADEVGYNYRMTNISQRSGSRSSSSWGRSSKPEASHGSIPWL